MSLATYDIRKLQFFRARIKETNRGRLYALAFVFCAAFILGAVEINHDVGIYDEGIMLTGAMRVVQGALPHRDFCNCSRLFFDCNFGEVVWKFDRRIRS